MEKNKCIFLLIIFLGIAILICCNYFTNKEYFVNNNDDDDEYNECKKNNNNPKGCDGEGSFYGDYYGPLKCTRLNNEDDDDDNYCNQVENFDNDVKKDYKNDLIKKDYKTNSKMNPSKKVKTFVDGDCMLIAQYPDIGLTARKNEVLKNKRIPKNNIEIVNFQSSCQQQNYMTAENYYNKVFRYPHIRLSSENDRWIPADYDNTNYLANATIYYNVSHGKKPVNSVPYPSNYIFAR